MVIQGLDQIRHGHPAAALDPNQTLPEFVAKRGMHPDQPAIPVGVSPTDSLGSLGFPEFSNVGIKFQLSQFSVRLKRGSKFFGRRLASRLGDEKILT